MTFKKILLAATLFSSIVLRGSDIEIQHQTVSEEKTHQLVIHEVRKVLATRKALMNQCKALGKKTVQLTLEKIDREEILPDELAWLTKQQRKILMNVGLSVLKMHAGIDKNKLLLMTQTSTPVLYKTVADMCKQLEMPVPLIFVCDDQDFINAAAIRISRNAAMIVIGKPIIFGLNHKELKSIIAHELGHIKLNHALKRSIALTGTAGIVALAGELAARYMIDFNDKQHTIRNTLLELAIWALSIPLAYRILEPLYQRQEDEADAIEKEVVKDPKVFYSTFEGLNELTAQHGHNYKIARKKLNEYIDMVIGKKDAYAARRIKELHHTDSWFTRFFRTIFSAETHRSDEERINNAAMAGN